MIVLTQNCKLFLDNCSNLSNLCVSHSFCPNSPYLMAPVKLSFWIMASTFATLFFPGCVTHGKASGLAVELLASLLISALLRLPSCELVHWRFSSFCHSFNGNALSLWHSRRCGHFEAETIFSPLCSLGPLIWYYLPLWSVTLIVTNFLNLLVCLPFLWHA